MQTGLERLLTDAKLTRPLLGKRIALLANPASVTLELTHSLDALATLGLKLTAAFGPQHGLRGDKQDNMIESPDYHDSRYNIPIFSLYGKVRRPTQSMFEQFDILLIDLQDIGCRIYTFVTTLRYCLEAAANYGKTIYILDRPNPVGRCVEGLLLRSGWESFVGAGPLPMRHGLTIGELAKWFITTLKLDLEYQIIPMLGWEPEQAPGYGWPLETRTWINPSPNAPNISMARCFAGTVLLEGTTLSEGRGTTRPLELFGAPDLPSELLLQKMSDLAPQWLQGCHLRPCWFEPTFHKHHGKLCAGMQIHVEHKHYNHYIFKPWRIMALAFKALRLLRADYELWRNFPYEYEYDRLAIDLINGSELLRAWVDDPTTTPEDFDALVIPDETLWLKNRKAVLLY